MAEMLSVNKDVCKILHKNVDEKFEAIDCCIKEISNAVKEMSVIAASNSEILRILMEERAQRNTNKGEQPQKNLSTVYSAQWFKWVAITLCIIAVVIVGSAVGNNILDKYIAAMEIVKGG